MSQDKVRSPFHLPVFVDMLPPAGQTVGLSVGGLASFISCCYCSFFLYVTLLRKKISAYVR